MNLDDTAAMQALDTYRMIDEIDGLPEQLEHAWALGQNLPLPDMAGIRSVVVAGMGGSAIGADLLAAYLAPRAGVPVSVHRDYDLPAWACGPETLVIASSHSGNTEETLSAYERALGQGCRMLAVSCGGKLEKMATRDGVPFWKFDHAGQPRAAVGFSFGLLLAALTRLGLLPDPSDEVAAAVEAMRRQKEHLRLTSPVYQNPAKRMAGQLVGRWVVVMGYGHLSPVARRWKGQISELAKAWAQFELLPEADHNTLAGVVNPAHALGQTFVLFLRSRYEHPRNLLRANLTREGFLLEGLNTDVFDAPGENALAEMWTAIHFGDYMAYYLAMAYGVDPTPVEAIENLKAAMKR